MQILACAQCAGFTAKPIARFNLQSRDIRFWPKETVFFVKLKGRITGPWSLSNQ